MIYGSVHIYSTLSEGGGKDLKSKLITESVVFCDVIEDEFHCLFECPRFNEARAKYGKFVNKPSMFKFINLLNSSVEKEQKQIARLAFTIQKTYKETLLG